MRSSAVPRMCTLVVLCVHLLHVSSGQLEAMVEKRSGSRYCGSNLAQALQLVCRGNYNGPNLSPSKKSNGDLIPADLMRSEESDVAGDGAPGGGLWFLRNADLEGGLSTFPFRPKASGSGHYLVPGSLSYHRVARGVHDECCRNSCTFQQLQMYCGRR